MSPGEQRSEIHCRGGLFPRQEARVAQLTAAINRAASPREKAVDAEALVEEADVLLQCEEYDEGSVDCRLCRGFSQLRRGAAALVVQAGALEDRRRSAGDDRWRP